MRHRALRYSIFAAMLMAASSAYAAPLGIVELFTSQGCSSCPPADKVLSQLASNPDLITLSFPVDYWDYIGWKDTFAKPDYTLRQRDYAQGRGDSQVYTPQAIIDGEGDVVGSNRGEVETKLKQSFGVNGSMSVPVRFTSVDRGLQVEISAGTGQAQVWLLRVQLKAEVAIARGENAGHKVTYTNIVRQMTHIGDWNGAAQKFNVSALKSGDGYVALVQTLVNGKPSVILGAAKSTGM